MLFSDIIGQNHIKRNLQMAAINNKAGHAYLFSGKEGAGKLPLAIAFARYLNCKDPQENDSCRECSSCRKFSKIIHPDLHFSFPVMQKKSSGKNQVSDDYFSEWKELILANPYLSLSEWYGRIGIESAQGSIGKSEGVSILKKLSFKNFEADYKVMIIWMADKMNLHAANMLLKIIEEPPPGTVIILIAENTDMILPTILSRVQLINVPGIESASMVNALKERHGIADVNRAESLAAMADGSYSLLLNLIKEERELNYFFGMFVKLMRLCFAVDIVGINTWIDEMAAKGKELQKEFLYYSLRLIRGNLMININTPQLDLLSNEEKEFSLKFSKFIHSGNVFGLTDEFNKAAVHLEYHGYSRLIFFDLALKTARLLKA